MIFQIWKRMHKCFVQYESQGITRFNSYGFLFDTERQDFVGVLGFIKGKRNPISRIHDSTVD